MCLLVLQITFVGAGVIGNVSSLEVEDFSGDNGDCSTWWVVTGFHNGNAVIAHTTQQQVVVSTQVGPVATTASHHEQETTASHQYRACGKNWYEAPLMFTAVLKHMLVRSMAASSRLALPTSSNSLQQTLLGSASLKMPQQRTAAVKLSTPVHQELLRLPRLVPW